MNYIEPVKNEKSKAKNFLKNSINFNHVLLQIFHDTMALEETTLFT